MFQLTPETATYDPTVGAAAGVFATGNYQATLALGVGAIPAVDGANEVVLTLRPLAPEAGATVPDGYRIAGNVIQITAAYRPTGGAVKTLTGDAQLTLSYPLVYGGIDDTLLHSTDGTTWSALKSTDHLGQQVVIGKIDELGFYTVGQTSGTDRTSGAPTAGTSGDRSVLIIAALIGIALIAVIAAAWVRSRRAQQRVERAPRRPPRRNDDPFDPWRE